jgi:hypothetical protein
MPIKRTLEPTFIYAALSAISSASSNDTRSPASQSRSVTPAAIAGVTRSLANKEIAATLNLSERTVKFHVSSLLTKFRVRGRMELAREATRRIPTMTGPQSFMTREARGYTPIPASYHSAPRVGPIALAKRQPMALS